MTPQVGDIWEWAKDDDICPVLLLEFKREDTYYANMTTLHFIGLELLTGTYDDFIFHGGNKEYWRKLA